MNLRKRATIKEVAQAAGVSTQTVSRVLNNRPDVSVHTRERIQAVIAELGYSPNVVARSLIQGRTNTLGVVGYGLSYYGPSRVLTGVQRRANELGYSLLLSLVRDPDSNTGEEIFLNLLDHQVDGIIWAVPEIGDNREWIARKISRFSSPVVFINMEPVRGLNIAAMDNREGGRLAAEHLLSQGYRNVGIITGPDSWWESRQRELGWREAMLSSGQTPAALKKMRSEGDWYPSSGETALEELLLCCPELEAVFVCNDPMAAGALRAARRLGRRVPEDLAVVGYDDTPEASYYYPSLTTIQQPLFELGGQAVEMLNTLLLGSRSGQEITPSPALWLHPEIVVRESSVRR